MRANQFVSLSHPLSFLSLFLLLYAKLVRLCNVYNVYVQFSRNSLHLFSLFCGCTSLVSSDYFGGLDAYKLGQNIDRICSTPLLATSCYKQRKIQNPNASNIAISMQSLTIQFNPSLSLYCCIDVCLFLPSYISISVFSPSTAAYRLHTLTQTCTLLRFLFMEGSSNHFSLHSERATNRYPFFDVSREHPIQICTQKHIWRHQQSKRRKKWEMDYITQASELLRNNTQHTHTIYVVVLWQCANQ